MGIYLNPLTKAFTNRTGEKTFIDHTGMLAIMSGMVNNEDGKYIAVSRPRRFGKTVDANMIAAFFDKDGDQGVFKSLEISKNPRVCEEHQGKYNVIKIDMSKGIDDFDTVRFFVLWLASEIISELREKFPKAEIEKEQKLFKVLEKINARTMGTDGKKTNEQFVIVIDEWDAPLRLKPNDPEGQRYYVSWLNDLFKEQGYLALGYMTGILPIKKYGDDSLMNMFEEYSMVDPGVFAPYMGFTEEDVAFLCERYGRKINPYKRWYDGYLMAYAVDTDEEDDKGNPVKKYTSLHVFNPKSIAKAFSSGSIDDYWDRTGSFVALQNCINLDMLGLRTSILEMMQGDRKPVNVKAYKNNLASLASLNQIYTLLVHLGYLTYDAQKKTVYIPNRELMEEFATATSEEAPKYVALHEVINDSLGLLKDTWNHQADKVAEAVEKSHNSACAPIDYNNEHALSIAVSFAYYAARACYTIIPEVPAGKGYADLTFIPVNPVHPAMVIELRWNKTVKTGIDQIRQKNYTSRLVNYAGNILCVGISYEKTEANDPAYKKHTCVIEQL